MFYPYIPKDTLGSMPFVIRWKINVDNPNTTRDIRPISTVFSTVNLTLVITSWLNVLESNMFSDWIALIIVFIL